jgi:hypothetical protein
MSEEKGQGDGGGRPGDKVPGLTAVAMLVAPLLTAVSGLALTGTIGRVQRDEPKLFLIAIGLVIAAGTFWVLASTLAAFRGRRSIAALSLRLLAFVFAAGGFGLAIESAIDAANNEPRPQITSTLSEDGTKLTVNVKASNLATEKRLAIRVDLLDQENTVGGEAYEAYIGPDGDGNIDHTVTLRLPKSDYTRIGVRAYTGSNEPKCFRTEKEQKEAEEREKREKGDEEDRVSGTGCVIITLPKYAVWN